ncbi:DUF1838 family protein [Algimonas porphyrae]|uniref:DUF1838 domain-containing protein n=1 Tax=Algimonas porphyrae TaxID=1128113 RepID=A0ABQ5V3Q8_9PROT|nr:DUF1838 family protein [Algimonas porphyrae]GLQ22093.1 hypothetical protein GCM10007854_30480 [Algimonas porphyrae]
MKIDLNVERRHYLKAGLGAVALGSIATSACSSTSNVSNEQKSPRPDLYDLGDPAQNLEAFVKVMGDLTGRGVWYTAKGRIYLIREGEMPLPFLGVEGLRYAKFTSIGDGRYLQATRDWALYRNIQTDQVLAEFDNPLTGQTVFVHPILTRYFDWTLDAQTGQIMEGYSGDAYIMERPFLAPWVRDSASMTVTLELLVRYASGVGGGEWFNLTAPADQINDPDRPQTAASLAWTGHSPIMSWLNMADIEGRTLWQSTGQKHSDLSTVSSRFKAELDEVFPGSLYAPETYEKPVKE